MIDLNLLRHYFGHLFFFTLVINTILGLSLYHVGKSVHDINIQVIEKTITEYGEFDLEHLCKITDCQKIRTESDPLDLQTYGMSTRGILIPSNPISIEYNFLGIKLDKELNSIVEYPEFKLTMSLNDKTLSLALIRIFYWINTIFIVVFTFMYFRNSFNEKKRNLLSLHDKETSIQEKYINLLNENINHELNTPVSILDSKLKKLQDSLTEYVFEGCNRGSTQAAIQHQTCKGCKSFPSFISEDFPIMFHAIEAITTVMERTSNWKQIKYSNGNTSIYDIIVNVKYSMGNFIRNNIQFPIDDALKDITLTGSYKNGDLQLCIMNHIKNSIEAKASIIQFEGELRKGKLHLVIIDNGHGIRDKHNNIIPPSKFEKIFDPYYSTKDGDNCERNNIVLKWLCDFTDYLDTIVNFSETKKNIKQIRGIGTYLNRTTLRSNGGDLIIRETTSAGTAFEIITAAKVKAKS